MSMDRRFRFALQLFHAPSGAEWTGAARAAEDLGYDVISMPDHFGPQFAPIPGLAHVAATTSRARLSMFVLANDFRTPAVLAKEAATLDVLSGGRLELGIGAGWNAAEFQQAGLEFAAGAERIARLAEAIEILKALFAGGPVEHHGPNYTIEGLELFPRPVQADGIPLVLGGGGEMMLALAAREADIISITTNSAGRTGPGFMGERSSIETISRKVAWIRDQAGARFETLELNVRVITVAVTDDREQAARVLGPDLGIDPDAMLSSPFALVGTTTQIADQLERLRETLAISYLTISQESAQDLAPVVARLART
jgi:probable F420-dependent oxidoreductase